MAMARLLVFIAVVLLPAIVSATRPLATPFTVEGAVYCDTCRFGFETSASTPISGARVRIECKNRDTMKLVYSVDGVTNAAGKYKIQVNEDHQEQLCDAVLVSSPQLNCAQVDPGRERARVILTGNNGMTSTRRYANAMGFVRDHPVAVCSELLKLYQEDE
ncbi:protein DOWNSTREAM OF FLC-like [Malania oleifera]|uniref:protein DOWNSTREAM OF FLC-like n=1 Tax=Malania oleifera TaxID=397392 RepID=UPI0025AEB6E8|nr:protein DOWNSTREAM OF FLC-like [Malania oleifera]